MTLPEAAKVLGLSAAGLRVQVRRGSLRATKRGRDWHVTPREVERYRAESLGRVGRPEGAKDRRPRGKPAVIEQRPG